MTRNILASKPRVTRFKINWDDDANNIDENNVVEEEAAGPSGMMENQPEVNDMEWNEELAMHDPSHDGVNSLQMLGTGGATNENSNSLAMQEMEC
jgi:histone chaperone ASF1